MSTRTFTHQFGAQFLSEMDSPGQPPASGKPAERGPRLSLAMSPQRPLAVRRMPPQGSPAQQSPNVGLADISTVQREHTKRNMGNGKMFSQSKAHPIFQKIDFLCFWWSRVSCLVQNGRSCKWCFKNCPWQDEKLVTLCWSLKLRKKEN